MDKTSENVINEIVSFWFSEPVKKLWFNSTPEFDAELKDKFLYIVERAERGEMDHWAEQAHGALALAIILDQFPLNIFRHQARSFATEAKARQVAGHAIANGLDQTLSNEQKVFLYLPFMHSENLEDQDKSVELFESAGLSENLRYAKHHRDIVRRFGRFPHRNKILGRQSTTEEVAYLTSKEAFLG
ncbi:MAG: hypothetical protein AMJ53_07125 [Gammaproteobacteria bacterium SG8_11]|nr:MAG: hypothetical protein AMJ53_07125 [Gammaproteobacteria bacterium SG8_11]